MVLFPLNIQTGILWRWVLSAVALLIFVQLFLPQKHISLGADSLRNSWPLEGTLVGDGAPIPNIVHYVWVMRDPEADFQLQFKHFVSAYSAYLYFHTDRIYIHTDVSDEKIVEARDAGDLWTRKVMNIPNLIVRHVEIPTHSNNGVEIKDVEHRSDFVRPTTMLEFGGVYMDFDVLPIRDVKPLREAGYRNVMGQELHEGINNGIWMSKPGTALMKLFNTEQHRVYDGRWTTHSTVLLTRLSNALVAAEREVLILEKKAFNPTAWNHVDFINLFQPHPENPPLKSPEEAAAAGLHPERDAQALYRNWNATEHEEWELDFSSSYVVHAMSPTHHGGNVPGFSDITLDYILSRESNYARAAFPATWHALENRVLEKEDT
jgi:hypothetical protein